MKITFEVDLTKFEDRMFVASLIQRQESQPPMGLQIHSGKDIRTPMTVWCSDEKLDEAVASLNKGDSCGEIQHESTDDPTKTPVSEPVQAEPVKDILTQYIPKKVAQDGTQDTTKDDTQETKKEVPKTSPAAEKSSSDKTPDLQKHTSSDNGIRIRELMLQASEIDGVNITEAKEVVKTAVGVSNLREMPADKAPVAIKALEAFVDDKKEGK